MVPPPRFYFCIFWVSIPSCDNLKIPFSKNMVAFLRQPWSQTFGPSVFFSYSLRADWGFLNQNISLWYVFKIFQSLLRIFPNYARISPTRQWCPLAQKSWFTQLYVVVQGTAWDCAQGKWHKEQCVMQVKFTLCHLGSRTAPCFWLVHLNCYFLSPNQPACLKLWILSLSSEDCWELCTLYVWNLTLSRIKSFSVINKSFMGGRPPI